MVKYIINVIILFLLILLIEDNEDCELAFHCRKDLDNNICLRKESSNSLGIFHIVLNSNFNNSLSCDVNRAFESDIDINIESKSKDMIYSAPSYLGGSCQKDEHCLIGVCQNSKCVAYFKCNSHEQCPLNTFCSNGTCKTLLENGEVCEDSYQCKFNSFCNLEEKKCQGLFTVENGTDINKMVGYYTNLDEICISGGYLQINESKKCYSFKNVNYQCDNGICRYKYYNNDGSEELTEVNENCLCGYNKLRRKNCVLGNGEQDYLEYLKYRKKFLLGNDYNIKLCHTLERDYREICNELINTNKSYKFRKFVQEYNNLKIKALEFHRIKNSESCVKEVIFGYDTNPIIPIKQQCPKYSCNNSLSICLLGNNNFSEEGNDINISLNSEICSVNENCILSSKMNSNYLTLDDILQIMTQEKILGTCSIYSYWPSIRYPGEDCNIDSDCISNINCVNGKCKGFDKGHNCTKTYECNIGLFCEQDEKICTEQKEKGIPCKETWDCKNTLGCYRGRCIELGILKPGVINNKETSPFPDNDRRDLLCNTGEMDWESGYCVETKYNDNWLKMNNKEEDANGFVECDYDEDCLYDNGRRTFTKKCGCGFNKEGQGYCPLPNNIRSDKWKERVKNIQNFANNDCHSLSRYNCYKSNTINQFFERQQNDKDTINAHLFYNAVPCAEKMFSFNEHIKFNFYLIFILFILNILF